jgi:hypothetical protein
MKVYGVDFTSAPSARKPIAVAHGCLTDSELSIATIEPLPTFEAFERFLERPGPWIAGFDFPFGLPRDAIRDFGWPTKWEAMVRHCAQLGRRRFAEQLNEDRISRPVGRKYRYRSGDKLAGSSPAVRLHQVPVGFMFFEGAPRLAKAKLNIPFLRENADNRIALEAYPGYLTKAQLGIASYKSDERSKQTLGRKRNRKFIVDQLRSGQPLEIRLNATPSLFKTFVDDPTADYLDSAICALQAAWGWKHRRRKFGLPAGIDSVEGWIATVPGP